MTRPLFIVIEGVDGSGKSTQIDLLKKKFLESNQKAMDTHEPSDGPIGMLLRNVLKGRVQTDQSTIAALFLADRLDHINNPIDGMKKRMQEGYNIICSRYYFSNYAFQSEYVPIDWVVQGNALCKQYLKPDLVFYLNVDPEIASKRITQNRPGVELYESLEKITKAHHAFLEAFEKYGQDENIHIIDGNQPVEAINASMWKVIQGLLVAMQKKRS